MDYSRTVRAAAVQLSPVLYSREGTTEKVLIVVVLGVNERDRGTL